MTLQEYVAKKAKEETPGRKGWKDRRLPRWKREYEEHQAQEAARRREAYKASPEGKAEAARRAAKEASQKAISSVASKLEVGQTISLRGSFNGVKEGQILSDRWLGSGFYSYSELRHADCVYIPEEIKVVVTRHIVGDARNFSCIKIKRIS